VPELILPAMPRTQMFLPNGGMAVAWQDFFRDIGELLGGQDVGSLNDLWTSLANDIYSTPVNYTKEIEDIKVLIESLPSPKSWDKEISELYNRVESSSISTVTEITIDNAEELEFYMQAVA
jgi:hypothetical protein